MSGVFLGVGLLLGDRGVWGVYGESPQFAKTNVCVCVCACVSEREREREIEGA